MPGPCHDSQVVSVGNSSSDVEIHRKSIETRVMHVDRRPADRETVVLRLADVRRAPNHFLGVSRSSLDMLNQGLSPTNDAWRMTIMFPASEIYRPRSRTRRPDPRSQRRGCRRSDPVARRRNRTFRSAAAVNDGRVPHFEGCPQRIAHTGPALLRDFRHIDNVGQGRNGRRSAV